jgi:hypothetical protein
MIWGGISFSSYSSRNVWNFGEAINKKSAILIYTMHVLLCSLFPNPLHSYCIRSLSNLEGKNFVIYKYAFMD